MKTTLLDFGYQPCDTTIIWFVAARRLHYSSLVPVVVLRVVLRVVVPVVLVVVVRVVVVLVLVRVRVVVLER